jgi:hypothetical protein
MFKEKNEGRVQLQSSGGNNYGGFDFQSAYAVGKHTAVQLNFFHASENEPDFGSGSGNYIEAAGGYFSPLNDDHFVFETYAGLGTGTVKNDWLPEAATTGVTKFFIQPSFGYTSKHFDMAFSSKFSMVNINVKNSTLSKDNNPVDFDYIEFLRSSKPFFFWEPGVIIRGGFRQFKFIAQVTETFPDNSQLSMDHLNASLGIMIPFKIKSGKNTK